MSAMLAPVRVAQRSAAMALVAGIGVMALTMPLLAIVALVGVVFSSVAKMSDVGVPVTKRRQLETLWHFFGGYAAVMGVLCLATIVLSFLLAHPTFLGPVAFFTLAACWLPLVLFMFGRKR